MSALASVVFVCSRNVATGEELDCCDMSADGVGGVGDKVGDAAATGILTHPSSDPRVFDPRVFESPRTVVVGVGRSPVVLTHGMIVGEYSKEASAS